MRSGRLMGSFAEETAKQYQFTREDMDAFAVRSLNNAKGRGRKRQRFSEKSPLRGGSPASGRQS